MDTHQFPRTPRQRGGGGLFSEGRATKQEKHVPVSWGIPCHLQGNLSSCALLRSLRGARLWEHHSVHDTVVSPPCPSYPQSHVIGMQPRGRQHHRLHRVFPMLFSQAS